MWCKAIGSQHKGATGQTSSGTYSRLRKDARNVRVCLETLHGRTNNETVIEIKHAVPKTKTPGENI